MAKKLSIADSKKVAALVARLAKHKETIAAERDALRETLEEYEAIIETCERADEAMETAIDALSEYVSMAPARRSTQEGRADARKDATCWEYPEIPGQCGAHNRRLLDCREAAQTTCGCYARPDINDAGIVTNAHVVYCPLHAAAPDLRDALRELIASADNCAHQENNGAPANPD